MGKSPDHPITRSLDAAHPITRSPDAVVLPRLYAIIDPAQSGGRPPIEVAEALLAAGVRLIQLRDKHASSGELYQTAQRVGERVRRAGGIFIVNDRADVARAVDADGVHVGQDDLPVESVRSLVGPGKLIGFSTHVLEQVREADRSTADYVAFGPVFPTASKENPDAPVGLGGLGEARKATRKPLVAIGGITLENARAAIEAGADSVAVIRGLVGAPDITRRAEEFLKQVSLAGDSKC
ncbi:MAG TPA: thiamine phosphate synthase [Terriglobia bacterium]|nr:thiamine phosphate synthase [Terriglobia bacterium]